MQNRNTFTVPRYKSTRIGYALWARVWPPRPLLPKLAFTVQGNKYPFIGSFYISDLYLKDMYIQGKDTWGLFTALFPITALAQGSDYPFLFVPSSPGSPTPPVPSSLPTTLPSPCPLILSAEVLLRSLCRKHPSGRGGQLRPHFHRKQVRHSR